VILPNEPTEKMGNCLGMNRLRKKTSWVRYAKNGVENGFYAMENGTGKVILRTNEPNLPRTAGGFLVNCACGGAGREGGFL
jgi:hypothetical protein